MKDSQRENTIDELRTALAELESDEGLERFVEGHGLQSLYFNFTWSEPSLDIDIRLPYARVLSGEEEQQADNARIGVVCRLAILLLMAADAGTLLSDGEARLSVWADEDGERYDLVNAAGETLDAGEDWDALVARLKASFPDKEAASLQVIWP